MFKAKVKLQFTENKACYNEFATLINSIVMFVKKLFAGLKEYYFCRDYFYREIFIYYFYRDNDCAISFYLL